MSYYQGRKNFESTHFNRPIPEQEEDELFTLEVRNMFKSKRWTIKTNAFELRNWHRVLSIIKQCPAQQLYLAYNARKQLIKQIVHISFANLQELNLSQNQIVNIEKICSLNAPVLQRIDFSKNLIVSVRPFRKAYLPNLKSARFYCNRIRQLGALTELKTGYYFSNFYVQQYIDDEDISEDLSWVVKVEPKSLAFLCRQSIDTELSSQLKIRQMKKMQMIKNKYPQAEMRKWTYTDNFRQQEDDLQDIDE